MGVLYTIKLVCGVQIRLKLFTRIICGGFENVVSTKKDIFVRVCVRNDRPEVKWWRAEENVERRKETENALWRGPGGSGGVAGTRVETCRNGAEVCLIPRGRTFRL